MKKLTFLLSLSLLALSNSSFAHEKQNKQSREEMQGKHMKCMERENSKNCHQMMMKECEMDKEMCKQMMEEMDMDKGMKKGMHKKNK